MSTVPSTFSAGPTRSPRTGRIDWCVARSALPIVVSVSTLCVGVNPMTNRCSMKSTIFTKTNPLKADNGCSVNAETLPHQCQKSVRLTLRLARSAISGQQNERSANSRGVWFLGVPVWRARAPAAPAPVIRQDERAQRVGLQVRARDIRASCAAQRRVTRRKHAPSFLNNGEAADERRQETKRQKLSFFNLRQSA